MTLDGVASFLATKTYEIHVNASSTVKVLRGGGGGLVSCIWKHLKDTFAFLVVYRVLESLFWV